MRMNAKKSNSKLEPLTVGNWLLSSTKFHKDYKLQSPKNGNRIFLVENINLIQKKSMISPINPVFNRNILWMRVNAIKQQYTDTT